MLEYSSLGTSPLERERLREREGERVSLGKGGRAGVRLGRLILLKLLSGIGGLSFFGSFCCQVDMLGHSAIPGATPEAKSF